MTDPTGQERLADSQLALQVTDPAQNTIAQVKLFDDLVIQELRALRQRTRFCSEGFYEVLQDLGIEPSVSYAVNELVEGQVDLVPVRISATVLVGSANVSRVLDGEIDWVNPARLMDVRAEAPAEFVVSVDQIDHELPAVIKRKAEIRAYAARRFAADDLEDVTLADVNGLLRALNITELEPKQYTYTVPPAGLITYQVAAETAVGALRQVKAWIAQEVQDGYLQYGELESGSTEATPARDIEPRLRVVESS